MGLSQKQLAQLINVSKHSLSDWETGKAKPGSSSVCILTEWLKHTDFDGPNKDFACSALGRRIATKRQEQGLSQKQLAQFLGVRKQTLNRWEIGAAFPRRNKLKRLMRLLSDGSFEQVVEQAKFVKLGQDIKKRRKRLSLTQPKLAERLGVSTKTVFVWERGGRPSTAKLEDIAAWLAEKIPEPVAGIPERPRIGKDIRKRRLALGISLSEVSRQLGVDLKTVRDWEADRFTPKQVNAIRIADWLSQLMPAKSVRVEVEDVVRRTKKKRQSLGWSKSRLTRHLGVGKNRVYEWEKGIRKPGPDSLKKMVQWLSEEVKLTNGDS